MSRCRAPAPSPVRPAAADEPAEVTVTARRRREAARNVPISITVMDGAALAAANLNSVRDFATQVPSLQLRMNTSQKDLDHGLASLAQPH